MALVVVTHPIALNDDDAIREKADAAMEKILYSLIAQVNTTGINVQSDGVTRR